MCGNRKEKVSGTGGPLQSIRGFDGRTTARKTKSGVCGRWVKGGEPFPELVGAKAGKVNEFVLGLSSGLEGDGAIRKVGPLRENFSERFVGLSVDRWRSEGNDECAVLDSDDCGSARTGFHADFEARAVGEFGDAEGSHGWGLDGSRDEF